MNLPVQLTKNPHTVDTREYYESLNLRAPYTQWATYTVDRLALVEGQDFSRVQVKQDRRGRPAWIYFFTPQAFQRLIKEPRWQKR